MTRMASASGDFELSMDELRAVARFAAGSAEEVLPAFEAVHPEDARPRKAIEAAWAFADGGRRMQLQRVAALDAHRAAAAAATEAARLAARAAGDAAAAAYLHPLADATQIGHILRAAALAARVAELTAADDPRIGEESIERARGRAGPVVVDVLKRYPLAPHGTNRVGVLMSRLDALLRQA